MKRLKTKGKNRIMSILLSVMLSIEQFATAMPLISTAAPSAQNSDSVPFPEIASNVTNLESAKLNHGDTLVDNGDGTFTFTSKISADYSFSDISESRLKIKDGYYDLDKEGTYLIELWGGDGGDGGRGFLTGRSGVGGSGGWVYGTLEVSEANGNLGKKLVYEIGSKGESKTYDIKGGGTDGDGGGAGELAFVSVGAGGGYSAVYLLDKKPVEENLITDPETAPSPPDLSNLRDDPEKVLMIAGGGGGGAAGANGFHLTALVLKMHADGGDGGSPESSIKATPDIGSFNTGTYYAGYNGTSSGGKTSYVGQGGTDRPEGIAKTTFGGMQASTYANDWQRIYHTELKRGVGGAGNLHGGGGGAGFAGGGGGIQNIIIDANNVGGGGGGSSYIASGYDDGTNTGIRGFQPLGRPDNDDYFVQQDENDNKEIGGAIVIRYLPEDAHYDYLNDVTISGTVSNYFDIVPEGTKCVNNVDGRDFPLESTPDSQNRKFTRTGNTVEFRGSVAPVSRGLRKGQAQDTLTLTLKLKPKTSFMGGNGVPIFNYTSDNAFSCTSGEGASQKQCAFMTDDTTSDKYADDYKVSHVNVPYNINFTTNNLVKSEGEGYNLSNLYTPLYPDASDPYISSITYPADQSYTVAAADVGKTKDYPITATITTNPGSISATVGTANEATETVTKTAYVRCIDSSTLNIDGFEVIPKKTLSYNNTSKTYDLTLDADVSTSDDLGTNTDAYVLKAETGANTQNNYSYNTSTQTFTVPSDGFYYIEARGAKGGNGGIAKNWSGLALGHEEEEGIIGYGGNGGYVGGYAYLTTTDVVSIITGKKGNDAEEVFANYGSNRRVYGNGGYGGAYSAIFLNNNPLIIAGGGAGGNGAAVTSWGIFSGGDGQGANGSNGTENGNWSMETSDLDNYYNGKNGIKTNSTDADSQDAGKNYRNTSFYNVDKTVTISDLGGISVTLSPEVISGVGNLAASDNGAVRITKLNIVAESDTIATSRKNAAKTTAQTTLNQYTFSLGETYSEYFEPYEVYVNGTKVDPFTYNSSTRTITVSGIALTNVSTNETAKTNPATATYGNKTLNFDVYSCGAGGKFNVMVKLKPKDGFLGGNDVPLLNVCNVSQANETYMSATPTEISINHTGTTADDPTDDTGFVKRDFNTDWANVELDDNGIEFQNISTDVIVDYGYSINSSDMSGKVKPLAEKYPSDSWKYDFVQLGDTEVSPTEPFTSDGICSVVGVLEPKATAQKAIVIPPVSAVKKSAQIDVKVRYKVTKALTNIGAAELKYINGDDTDSFTPSISYTSATPPYDQFTLDEIHDAYVLELSPPVTGYDLPAESAVKVYYGTVSTDKVKAADVSKKDGKLIITIPSSAFTNNITIEAEGEAQTENNKHQVHYYYEVYDPNNGINNGISYVSADGGKYNRGEVIDEAKPYTPASGDYPEGYTSYCWTWPDGNEDSAPHTMGDTAIYVIGRYVPETYKLVIKYCMTGSSEPFDTYTSPDYTEYDPETDTYDIALTDGATYMVRSPEKAGYTPRQAYISGTVDEAFKAGLADMIIDGKTYRGKERTVYYDPAAGNLTVYKVECDKYGIPTSENTLFADSPVLNYTVSGDFDKEDDIVAPAGYRIYQRTKLNDKNAEENVRYVSGTLKADEKAVYYVYYKPVPQTVTVNFHEFYNDEQVKPPAADIILEKTSRNAAKGMEYGYDPDSDTFVGLPTAVCKEYIFDGWYTASGQLIEDDMIVPENASDPIELYAHWKDAHITINVDYWYGNNIEDTEKRGTTAGDSKHYDSLLYGMSYSIKSYDIAGYEASEDPVTGVALKNETRNVYYSDAGSSTKLILNVNIYSKTYMNTENPALPKTNANKLKEGTFVLYDSTGTNQVGTLKENKDGTVSWTNVDAGIAANGTYMVKCEDPPPGYGADSITVELTSPQTDQDGNSVYTANFFLDRSPFRLPPAGGTPVTGYTVFGISTMLLAAFLLFLYVSSKSEENENE